MNLDGPLVAFCWAHQRRDFVEFQAAHPEQPALTAWADEWLNDIAQLYQLNDRRLAVRDQPEAWTTAQAALEAAIQTLADKIHSRQGLPDAQRRVLESMNRHWSGLTLFVLYPDLPMDNNWSERLLRLAVLGRKNYNGHQTQRAGEFGAMMFTFIQTCLANEVNPYAFLLNYFKACAEQGHAPADLTPFSPWLQAALPAPPEALPP